MSSQNNYGAVVESYYPKVDNGDIEWVIDLFAENGEYKRADAVYSGKQAIADFYRNDRKIRGAHVLERVLVDGPNVVTLGRFVGKGHDGGAKDIGFSDYWQFDATGRVVLRKTFLALGNEYVKS